MTLSRRLSISLLVCAMALPPTAALAQGDLPELDLWTHSEDGQMWASTGDPDVLIPVMQFGPSDVPPALRDLPLPPFLYGVGENPNVPRTILASVQDSSQMPFVGPGATPVFGRAIGHGDTSVWTGDQHIISVPQGCSAAAEDMGSCVHPWLFETLIRPVTGDAAAAEASDFLMDIEPGGFTKLSTIMGPGTIVGFGGDSTVRTDVNVKPSGTIVIRGSADIGTGLGGKLRGFDAQVVEIPSGPGATPDDLDQLFGGTLAERRAILAKTKVKQGKPNRVDGMCPASGQGYVVGQFFIKGFARNATVFLGDDVEGGAPVVISEIIPFDCIPGGANEDFLEQPGEGPAAGLACLSMGSSHSPFKSRRNGESVTDPSSIWGRVAVATSGIGPAGSVRLEGLIGQANGGESFEIELVELELVSPESGLLGLYAGEFELGIDDFGKKPIRQLGIANGFGNIDLTDQAHQLFGDAFKVTQSEDPVGDCPQGSLEDFGDTLLDEPIFADGFESGDVSAWSTTVP